MKDENGPAQWKRKTKMVVTGAEDEHKLGPPTTRQREEQTGKHVVCGSSLFCRAAVFSLIF